MRPANSEREQVVPHGARRSELILVYHAVTHEPLEVADFCFVTADTFRQQMLRLRETFEVVPLEALAGALGSPRAQPMAAVTFDDGFLNNQTVALPILRELDVPATVFLATDFVDTDRMMWFCELNRAIANTELATMTWDGEDLNLSSTEARANASTVIQASLKKRPEEEMRAGLESVLGALGADLNEPAALESPYRMLTGDAIAEMATSGLIDFGAHTKSHPILSHLSPEQQEREITGSIRAVERLTGRRCRMFAYPNGRPGDYDATTLEILERNGVEIAVTALPGTNDAATPRLELHRQGFVPDFAVPGWATASTPAAASRGESDPIRLLFAYPFFGLGGVETATLAKVGALDRAGIEAWIYLHQAYGEGGAEFLAHPRVMAGLQDEATLAALLDQDWDAVILIDYPTLLDLLDKYQVQRDVIFESHAGLTSFQDRVYPRLSHPRIRTIVLPSHANARRLRETVGHEAQIDVIPNAVDPVLFDPAVAAPDPGLVRLQLGEQPILWIGRLEDEKNPQELIEIVDALLKAGERIRVVMLGDLPGQYEDRRSYLQGLMSDRARAAIEFVQHVPHHQMPDVYRWVAQHDGLLLSTSRYETQPMIFLEAMAARCPIVSSAVGSVDELIEHGTNGHLYPLGDIDAGARAVRDVLSPSPETLAMIDRARERIVKEHSPDAVARRYRQLLEGLGMPSSGRARRVVAGQQAQFATANEVPGLVSTIVPVHDRPSLLRQAVASVQAQTYTDWELILVDDGSGDETASLCDRLAALDARIRVLHLEHIGFAGPVREAGRQAARGEFLQYLDSDDLLAPRKFEAMVSALHEHPKHDVAYSATRRYSVGTRGSTAIAVQRTGEVHAQMLPRGLANRFWYTSTPMYRRRLTDLVGPWSDLRVWEDVEYDMRVAALKPRLVYRMEFLTDIRDHPLPRLSRSYWFDDPQMLRETLRASTMIHAHAVRGGVTPGEPEMGDLLEDVRFIAFHLARLGLDEDVARATALMREISSGGPIGQIAMPDLKVLVEPQESYLVAQTGESIRLHVRVVNRSSIRLRSGLLPMGLSFHLFDAHGQVVAWDGPRVFFSAPLPQGQERSVRLPVTAPAEPGRYTLELDAVWESVTWFKDAGSPTTSVPLYVGIEPDVRHDPLVSVVIPAYDQAAYLPEAVESVRWQTYSNWECVIVDDGSTDRTPFVARALAAQDSRVRYHRQDNQGLSAARNAGLALSRGEYVQFLDADDVIAPTKLRRQVELMKANPTVGVSYTNFWRFDDSTGEPIDRSPGRLGPQPLEDFLFLWERGLTIPVHAGLFRRDLWPDGRPFETRLRGREDWVMWVDLALRETRFAFVDADLAWYRIHERNMVHDRAQMLGWLLEGADLIRERIPARYRRSFVEDTIRHLAMTARAQLDGDGGSAWAGTWDLAVEELEIVARQMSRRAAGSPAAGLDDLIDEFRVVALACRREGRQDLAQRCSDALQALGVSGERRSVPPSLVVRLEPIEASLSAKDGEDLSLLVRVRNDSDVSLRNGSHAKFALSSHLLTAEREVLDWDGGRVPFEEPLRPGGERVVELTIHVPEKPGRYIAEVDVVCEGVIWFGEAGSATAPVEIRVGAG